MGEGQPSTNDAQCLEFLKTRICTYRGSHNFLFNLTRRTLIQIPTTNQYASKHLSLLPRQLYIACHAMLGIESICRMLCDYHNSHTVPCQPFANSLCLFCQRRYSMPFKVTLRIKKSWLSGVELAVEAAAHKYNEKHVRLFAHVDIRTITEVY